MNLAVRPTVAELSSHQGPETHAVLSAELVVDAETPIALYRRLGGGRHRFLLESVEGGELVGRYSFFGADPARVLVAGPQGVVLREGGSERPVGEADPLAALKAVLAERRVLADPSLPPFHGGAVGYLGFDAIRHFEPVPLPERAATDQPEALFLLADEVCIYDHLRRRLVLVTQVPLDGDRQGSYEAGAARLRSLAARLVGGPPALEPAWPWEPAPSLQALQELLPITCNRSPQDLQSAIETAREAIREGEIFQVVLSQRLDVAVAVDPFGLYRALRATDPSPYMFLLELDGFAVVGASPEVLVRAEGGELLLRPIAGTRRRGRDATEDQAMEAELCADEKELAEHRMLLDLGRNDLGRVAAVGSVRVERPLHVERYSHVMHLVSDVRARLAPGRDAYDALRAAFPAGTLSGAPKVRACELIARLEPERRGIYGGAVGYFDPHGNMDTCIAIRTLVVEPEVVRLQSGAGIVMGSIPRREVAECWNKARAGLAAIWRATRRAEDAP